MSERGERKEEEGTIGTSKGRQNDNGRNKMGRICGKEGEWNNGLEGKREEN